MGGIPELHMAGRGGAATTRGISYQALAIVRELLDVLAGRCEYVRPHSPNKAELPGASSTVETGLTPVRVEDFVAFRGGCLVYHEAKSAAPGGGTWTVRKLDREGVLRAFRNQIDQEPEATCRLVSPNPCPLFEQVAEEARSAESLSEFEANLGVGARASLDEMCVCLAIESAAAYSMLRACHAEVVSAESLSRTADSLVSSLFGDSGTAQDVLFKLAMEAMAKGTRVDAALLRERLSDRGVYEKPPVNAEAIADGFRNASAILRTAKRETAGVHIEQLALQEMARWMGSPDADGKPCGVLLDHAGMGKTAAMSGLLTILENDGWTVLGLKADAVGDYGTVDELAARLDLLVPIPAAASALVHAGHKVAVLVDQVDALSTATARDPSAIAVLLDTVARLAQVRGTRVILSCRSFDWHFDASIRQLRERAPHEFHLKAFSPEEVERILATRGLKAEDLHPVTRTVLQTPQHLDGFICLVDAKRTADPAWSPDASHVYTLQSLYDDLWETVLRKATFHGRDETAIAETAEQAAADMQQRQHLSLPVARLEVRRAQVDWLVSEGILLRDERTVRFFHQTFFDFIVARRFVRSGESLTDYLVSSDQGLFFRPLLKQVLQYLRATDRQASRKEVTKLLNDSRIRRHLKRLVYEWLGQLPDAGPHDLVFFEPMLSDQNLLPRAVACMRGNAAWLDILTPSRVRRWLWSAVEAEPHVAVRYLESIAEERQRDVIPLLAPLVGRSEEWNGRVAFCLQEVKHGWTDEAVGLLSRLVLDPQTAIQGDTSWWDHALLSLAKDNPTAACAVVAKVLSWMSPDASGANQPEEDSNGISEEADRRFPDAYGFWEALKVISEEVPRELLMAILPAVFEAMRLSCRFAVPGRLKSSALLWDYTDEDVNNPARKMAVCLAQAVFALADGDAAAFRQLVAELTDNDLMPAQRLVADAYARRPQEYAEDAACFLLADVRHLRLGTYDSEMWSTRQLVKACSPFWSDEQARAVEKSVLEGLEQTPRTVDQARRRGFDKLELLSAFEEDRLSTEGRAELRQLDRKFPDFKPHPPQGIRFGFVGPPITDDAIARMNDRGWLGAMRKYVDERPPREWGKPIALSGGRRQLSQALERRAREEPGRFFGLATDRMDESYHPDYVGAIVRGIADGGAPFEMVWEVIRKFRAAMEPNNIRDITHALGKYRADEVTAELEAIVKEWALSAPDPAVTPGQPYEPSFREDLITDGINTDRGSCLWLLARLYLQAEPRRMLDYLDLAEAVVHEPCPSVRAVCLHFLPYATPADAAPACRVFQQLLGSDRQALLQTRGAGEFVYYSMGRCTDSLLDIVEEMVADAGHSKTQQRGANLACLCAFGEPAAEPLRDRCLTGNVAQRSGAAEVYAANLNKPDLKGVCQAMLRPLWDDESADVRQAACRFIEDLDARSLRDDCEFIRDWMSSSAFADGAERMADKLSKMPNANPQLTIEFGRTAAETLGRAMADFQRRQAMVPYHLIPAIVSLYHSSAEPATRAQCMDILKDLDEVGCDGIADVYQQADRF